MSASSSRTAGPYLSIVIALRDDNYPRPLRDRVRTFANRLVSQLGDGGDGLYELVVVDWNRPRGASAAASFDFGGIRRLRHVVVPPGVHDMIASSSLVPAFRDRPMLDYYARNVGIRCGLGAFILVVNQDILLSDAVASFIRERRLGTDCFYRADRMDIDVDPAYPLPGDLTERMVLLHRRHSLLYERISVASGAGSVLHADERTDRGAFIGRTTDEYWSAVSALEGDPEPIRPATFHSVAPSIGLHTNGGGDFILAHRDAWAAIRGFPETDAFYWHLDAYAICCLWAAGYRQALFAAPDCVFHVEHARSNQAAREVITWDEHDVVLGRILDGSNPPFLNAPSWGLPGLAGIAADYF